MKRYIEYFFKGVLIGISFLVPGMSGGTMMVLLDVFDEAIHSINAIVKGRLSQMGIMVMMGIGTVLSFVLFSPMMLVLIDANYTYTISFFMGVVVVGIWVLYKDINIRALKAQDLFYFSIGVILVILLDSQASKVFDLTTQSSGMRFLILLIVGVPIAFALILPGISTSFVLLSIGAYEMVLNAMSTLNWSVLVPLGIGTVAGTLMLSGFLEKQLQSNKRRVYVMIIGFIVGSIIGMAQSLPQINSKQVPYMVALFIIGGLLMFVIELLNGKKS